MIANKSILAFPLIIFSLLTAVWSGWIRIGWNLPVTTIAAQHGALMVNSFLASLIFLERAVTFRNKWILLIPLFNSLSVLAFVFGLVSLAQLLFIAGSAGFVAICVYFIYQYEQSYYYIFLIGSICLLLGNVILFKTNFYPDAVIWWIGFLLFTIVAERLELSRFLALMKFKRNLLWASIIFLLITLILPFHLYGYIFLAVAIAMISLWLLKYDMARHSVKVKGQHRYSGLLLITGYVWLLIMSVLLVFLKHFTFGYDAVLHSFFIGFVFSMIFSHAPVILPAVMRLSIKIYRPILYLWFVLLQVSLVIRVIADCIESIEWRRVAGLANGLIILLFFISVAFIVRQELRKRISYHSANSIS
jgi:hypothetical protein